MDSKETLLARLDAVPSEAPLFAVATRAAALLRASPVLHLAARQGPLPRAEELRTEHQQRLELFRERGIEKPGLAETVAMLGQQTGAVRVVYVDSDLGSLTLMLTDETSTLVGCLWG